MPSTLLPSSPSSTLLPSSPSSTLLPSSPSSTLLPSSPSSTLLPSSPSSTLLPSSPSSTLLPSSPSSTLLPSSPSSTLLPSSPSSTLLPSSPSSTLLPSSPSSTLLPSSPSSTLLPSSPSSTPVHKMIFSPFPHFRLPVHLPWPSSTGLLTLALSPWPSHPGPLPWPSPPGPLPLALSPCPLPLRTPLALSISTARRTEGPFPVMKPIGGEGHLPWYTEEDLKRATGNWQVKLGEGGYGAVYKGMLAAERVRVPSRRGGSGISAILSRMGGSEVDESEGEEEIEEEEDEEEGEGAEGEEGGEGEEGVRRGGGMGGLAGFEVVEIGGRRFVPVAVKICRTEDNENLAREQLLTEVMVMTALRHPNVLRLLGVAMMGQAIAIVSEFLPGGDVTQRLERAARGVVPFPWKDRLSIAVGSVAGLAAIHKEGFIHRDFKAANVLLTKDLVPKVADFGLAKTCQDRTHVTTRVAGSKGYIDPSYFETGILTAACDVFAFGVFLLELLSGHQVHERCFPDLAERATGDPDQVVDASLEGQWERQQAEGVLSVIRDTLTFDFASRPSTEQLLKRLKRVVGDGAG
ncbi:unnamed protein product [Closterium sp. Yama58-4]|nr:unnamed protein product [Closterium sp. Yama58-4]